ncbi:MAG: hypothetical protein AB1416_13445, partial [Actinomycetota bacterium]
RETLALIHGIVLGALFLVAFTGGLAELWALRTADGTSSAAVTRGRVRRLQIGTVGMAAVVWATVAVGTFVVYPWYRETGPTSAKSRLLAGEDTAGWHELGMEWKEHVSWISPFLATAVAVIAVLYGRRITSDARLRNLVTGLFVLAFLTAAVAGIFGALITKAAPVR